MNAELVNDASYAMRGVALFPLRCHWIMFLSWVMFYWFWGWRNFFFEFLIWEIRIEKLHLNENIALSVIVICLVWKLWLDVWEWVSFIYFLLILYHMCIIVIIWKNLLYLKRNMQSMHHTMPPRFGIKDLFHVCRWWKYCRVRGTYGCCIP